MKNLFPLLFLVVLLSFSCQENKKEKVQVEEKKVVEAQTPKYEGLPQDLILEIYNSADGLEGSFYHSGKSVTLWNENVRNVLAMMTGPAPLALDNNIVGHIMFLSQGNKVGFAELSMKEYNNYVIFTVGDKKYYNNLNEQGLNFFKEMTTLTAPPVRQ